MKNIRVTFGIFVHQRRKALGLTQAELADQIGLSVDAVGQIERGKIAASFDTIGALAAALKAHPAELFGGRPLVPGKRRETADRIAERLADATPAQLRKIATVIDAMLD